MNMEYDDIKPHIFFVVSMVMTLVIGYCDYLTGANVSVILLYSFPVLMASRLCGKTEGFIVAATAATSWLIANVASRHGKMSDLILSWNALSRFSVFALLAYTVSLQVALKRALENEKLRASTDWLTGLFNKGAYREQVETELNLARRYGHPISLAFIDLDDFKLVNDTHGHARGDRLLQLVSETIQRTIRKTDIAGRIGGDEFALCFPETGPDKIQTAIEKLLRQFDIMTSQSGWQLTISIGVVTYTKICDSYDAMLGKADQLMYRAKVQGKNRAEYSVI